MESVVFTELASADLVVDRNYQGGAAGNRGDDPISKLLPVGNSGGFRFRGSPTGNTVQCLVLYTSSNDPDWPDRLDLTTGTFQYYGDNKKPGRELHDTPRKGNLALKRMFSDAQTQNGRENVPPIFLFSKTGVGADATFRGLLVPGAPSVPVDEQLVAIWRSSGDQRFQNYRATFSVLDQRSISRRWIDSILAGTPEDPECAPRAWLKWRRTGVADRLLAPRTTDFRTRQEQLPRSDADMQMLAAIHHHFSGRPHEFEVCAAELWMMLAPATDELVVTQPSRDGGRDAVGQYRIGPPSDLIRIDFALEAKCYAAHNSVGVREMSRLISRLRHRNFGVLVTTSWVNPQAYREIREDAHPVVVVCGADIIDLLKRRGWGTASAVKAWLEEKYPTHGPPRVDLSFVSDPQTPAKSTAVDTAASEV